MYIHTYIHTHTYIHVYIYIYRDTKAQSRPNQAVESLNFPHLLGLAGGGERQEDGRWARVARVSKKMDGAQVLSGGAQVLSGPRGSGLSQAKMRRQVNPRPDN